MFTPNKYPHTVVLRANQLWLEVEDADIRRYLLNYLARPQWQSRSWDEISNHALLPADANALHRLFTYELGERALINNHLIAISNVDADIDDLVLDLYGITDPADRARVLGSAPLLDDADSEETAEIVEEA